MENKIKNTIDQIHAQEELKQNTKVFLQNNIYQKSQIKHNKSIFNIKSSARVFSYVVAFACLCLLAVGFGGYHIYTTPVYAMSIDVNPSIQLTVNRFDRVIKVDAYNEEGLKIIEETELKNKNYDDAVCLLFENDIFKSYVVNGEQVSITVVGKDEENTDKIYEELNNCSFMQNSNIECEKAKNTEMEEAKEAGISVGKYHAICELEELEPQIDIENLKDMKMHEIKEEIKKISGNSENCSDNNGNSNANNNVNSNGNNSNANSNGNSNGNNSVNCQDSNSNGNHYGSHNENKKDK